MRVFFKAGGFAEKPCGWYRFWIARASEKSMVFRMPDGASNKEIFSRAKHKLNGRKITDNYVVLSSDEAGVVRWLMAHRKKAELGEHGCV